MDVNDLVPVLPCPIDNSGRIRLPRKWVGNTTKVFFVMTRDPLRVVIMNMGPRDWLDGFAFEHKVDPKGRVSVPKVLRDELDRRFQALYLQYVDYNTLEVVGETP